MQPVLPATVRVTGDPLSLPIGGRSLTTKSELQPSQKLIFYANGASVKALVRSLSLKGLVLSVPCTKGSSPIREVAGLSINAALSIAAN